MNTLSSGEATRSLAEQSRAGGTPELPFVSLFSGIAGMDAGLVAAGGTVVEFCESWEPARRILHEREPTVPLSGDVREFTPTKEHRLLAAGFPCVDLSHAGRQAGIFGEHSGLVSEAFRIASATRPEWIVLENVPNLLRLGRGAGIRMIIGHLEDLGYEWAYRVLDSRAFGVAQRRHRVIVLAALTPGSAAAALLGSETRQIESFDEPKSSAASGFYWTEGRRGVGLVRDAVPTLKGGSTLGLPSAPAVWRPGADAGQRIVLPSIEDAEVLQGFDRGWTASADTAGMPTSRWKLVGNAVTVPLAKWIGERIIAADTGRLRQAQVKGNVWVEGRPWPDAAFGGPGRAVRAASASRWPVRLLSAPLDDVLDHAGLRPLSFRATRGFLSRIEESGIKLDEQFLDDLEDHLSATRAPLPRPDHPATAVAGLPQRLKQPGAAHELNLRRALSDRGLQYRLQERPIANLRWRSDVVFRSARVFVNIRDCFWHSCSEHKSWPEARVERWASKRVGLKLRNELMVNELQAEGWQAISVWGHEDAYEAAAEIELVVRRRSTLNEVPGEYGDSNA